MKHNYSVENDNLKLIPLEPEHLETVRVWRNELNTRTRFISQNIISEEQQRQWYANYLKKDDDLAFIIVDKDSAKPIGTVSLCSIRPETGEAELGREIIGDVNNRGKGYGASALKLVIDFAFKQLNLDEVYGEVLADNAASIRMLEKCGLTFVEKFEKNNLVLHKMVLKKNSL
jgi:diamine N-acetyltransferase